MAKKRNRQSEREHARQMELIRTAKPRMPRLAFGDSADVIAADLNRATEAGLLVRIVSHVDGPIHVSPITLDGAWGVPVFDFGHMDDVPHPDWIGKPATDECFRLAYYLNQSGDFHLPFPESMFIFRYAETARNYDTLNVVIASEYEDGEIEGRLFSKCFTNDRLTERWRMEPIEFILYPRGGSVSLNRDRDVALSAHWQSEYEKDARNKYTNLMVAITLMARKAVIIETSVGSERAAHVAGEKSTGEPPIIRRILFNRVEIQKLAGEAIGHHAPPRPHIRRGHYRTLRSGRIVPVRAAKVLGGGDAALVYEAVSDTPTDLLS